MQPCKTRDQPYSDTSPNGECSLRWWSKITFLALNYQYFSFLSQVEASFSYPIKKGPKNGLFKSQIGLNITVGQELFRDGKIRIKCVGAIEDGILQVKFLHCVPQRASPLLHLAVFPRNNIVNI